MDGENPLVAKEKDSTTWYTGIGIAESVDDLVQGIKSGNWIDIGLGALTTGLEALSIYMDPIGSVASNLISFIIEHFGPLQDALDKLAGNADAVAAHAQTWKNISKAVAQAKADYEREAKADTAGWKGAAADAYRRRAADTAALMDAGAKAADGLGSAVEMAGMVVGVVRETVRDLIADLVGRGIVWAAEALTVVGAPLAAKQAAVAAAKWAARIAQIIKKLIRTLQNLIPLLRKLKKLFEDIRKKMDELFGGGGDKPPPKDRDGDGIPDEDPFDNLPPHERDALINQLIRDSNPDFPLTRANAEAMLRGGPPGTTPTVAGPGGEGGDIQFKNERGEVVERREAKATDGTFNTFDTHLRKATGQIQNKGEVWFQVPDGATPDQWLARWQGRRTDEQLGKYADVDVVFRDASGREIGRYNLGQRR
ncbi:hypothetical protein EV193_12020 [Herbihabitans rhizosphaerae]|uniref:WXG100 family type VII secretion target n=1 Tax=Herbihabitans rhizosphaerae TaxID=1872711 RepID=A0A4Q7KBL1_9PSEU|nr:hypothetical protein [Herbihabitans rhizosphaerae]RZS29535.1 hypothetical protein EV193_12020 [Herbihabitans rhizosphaerae]